MYHGWQVQPRENSVQATVESALSILLKDKISVVGCGRTDAGVHAEQFFLHFDALKEIDEKKLKRRLNSYLPADIAVYSIIKVKQDAHARFHAVSRSYQYRISMEKNVFLSHLTLQLMQAELDVEKMNEAAQLLMKHEDFKCFSRSKTDVKTYLCDISEAFWKWEGKELIFQISANRFLRNMVRAVVGTLLEVGKHKMSISEFEDVIKSRDRTRAGASVKAKGLFLTKVDYPDEIFNIS